MEFSDFCTLLLACAIFALVHQLARAEADPLPNEPNLPPPPNPPISRASNQSSAVRSQPLRSATPGPSMIRAGPSSRAADPSVSHVPAAPASVDVGAGPPSFPWTPKKGWSSTCRLGNAAYFRFERRMQPRRSTNPASEEPNPVLTPYWVADKIGMFMPTSPPNLSSDPKLCLGDVFIFHTATEYRLWIWVQCEGRRFWKRVSEGYQRADGKCLLVTEVKREPSWVTKEHYERSIYNRFMAQVIVPHA